MAPMAPPHPCSQPNCPNLVPHGQGARCQQHRRPAFEGAKPRPTSRQRGYSAAWEKASKGYLAKHPFCTMCEAEGKLVLAEVVDHIVDHRGDMALFWDADNNWQPLCQPHHRTKTAKDAAQRSRGNTSGRTNG